MADLYVFERTKKSEYLKQVYHHRNHNNRIQNAFDLGIHRNVCIYEPEEYSDNNQQPDNIYKRHKSSPRLSAVKTLSDQQGSGLAKKRGIQPANRCNPILFDRK